MKFLQDLVESRMIRTLDQLDKRSVSALASKLFTHLLALRVLYHEDARRAQDYVRKTMRYQDFAGFRASSPDMYNLLVFIDNPSKYQDHLTVDTDISLPELRLKRNFREIARGNFDSNDYDGLMLLLQRRIPSLGNQQIALRREINRYERLPADERSHIIRRLLLLMRNPDVFSDLHLELRQAAKDKGYPV